MHKAVTPAEAETHTVCLIFHIFYTPRKGQRGHMDYDDDPNDSKNRQLSSQSPIVCSQYQNTIIQRSPVCATPYICTHTSHIYILKHSNVQPSSHTQKKTLAALYLKDTTDWKCVRKCETQSPERSLFSMSVTESGCLLNPPTHTCTASILASTS